MTLPVPEEEPWSDERLAVAYRAAFGMTTPKDVEDRVERALYAPVLPSRRRWGASLKLSGFGAIASLTIVVAAVLISNGLPRSLPNASGATGTPQPTAMGNPTTGSATTRFPDKLYGIAVLSVPQAIEVRDHGSNPSGGADVAVSGWYQPGPVILCPVYIPGDSVQFLEGFCGSEAQVLLPGPEPVPYDRAGSISTGVSVAFDGPDDSWARSGASNGALNPTPVVLVGHFNDPRSASCRSGYRDLCRRRFVVDQVPWVDGSAHGSVYPAEVEGIPVWSVEKAIQARDAGETHGIALAIGAWYAESVPIAFSCLPPSDHWGDLERYCHGGQQILADVRQTIDISRPPVGTSLAPILSSGWTGSFLSDRLIPQRVVLAGHFDDPLAIDCPHLGAIVCAAIFVVDQIAWSNGAAQGVRIGSDFRPVTESPGRTDQEGEDVVLSAVGRGAVILSITSLEIRDVASFDPTASPVGNPTAPVWYIRAVEPTTHRIGSFVVDQSSLAILWKSFPMPAVGAP